MHVAPTDHGPSVYRDRQSSLNVYLAPEPMPAIPPGLSDWLRC